MTVATGTKIRNPSPRGIVIRQSLPSESYYGGWLVGRRRGSRYCEVPTSTSPKPDLIIEGVAEYIESPPFTASSTADSGGGAIDAITRQPQNIRIVTAPTGWFDQTGTTITEDHVGLSAYAANNNTVSLSDSNGTLPRAGTIDRVNADGKVSLVFDNKADDLFADDPPTGPTVLVVITSLPANTVTAGVMTADATGAWGAQDTGITLALGDEVFIPEGTTNLDNAQEAGPWVVATLGAVGVAMVLRRPSWWPHGGAMPLGAKINVASGTIYGGSTWRSDAAKGSTIGTTAPAFWPEFLCVGVTLASGTASAITTLPVKSLTKSQVTIQSTPTVAPHSSTRVWRISALTAGTLGTCSITPIAESAPGTTNASDVGTYTISVRN